MRRCDVVLQGSTGNVVTLESGDVRCALLLTDERVAFGIANVDADLALASFRDAGRPTAPALEREDEQIVTCVELASHLVFLLPS